MPLLLRSARRLTAAKLEKVAAEQGATRSGVLGLSPLLFYFRSRMMIAKKTPALVVSGLGKRLR